MNVILKINNKVIDYSEETLNFFRITKNFINTTDFSIGGEFSSSFTIPITNNNLRVLNITTNPQSFRFRNIHYPFELSIDNNIIFEGTLYINRITKDSITVEVNSSSSNWISKLNSLKLNELGYVDGKPTWFGAEKSGIIFKGGQTFDLINNLTNAQTDYVLPTIIYYKSPITDYLGFTDSEIFGEYDSNYNELVTPKSFPSDFHIQTGYLSSRSGLTFEDFPPAIYYSNLIEKIFTEANILVSNPLTAYDWFNQLIIPFNGESYKYNWNTLSKLELVTRNNFRLEGTYDWGSRPLKSFVGEASDYTYVVDIDNPTATYKVGVLTGLFDITIGSINSVIDYIDNFGSIKMGSKNNKYICPQSGIYKISVNTDLRSIYQIAVDDAPYAAQYLNIGNGNPDYHYTDVVIALVRYNEADEFVLSENPLDQMISMMTNQPNSDLLNNPCDIIAFVSPYRIDRGIINRTSIGTPYNSFQSNVTLSSSYHSYTETSITGGYDTVIEYGASFEVEVELRKNERVQLVAIPLLSLVSSKATAINIYPTTPKFSINDSQSGYTTSLEVTYDCSTDDLSLADNLPNITAKEFISDFVKRFNLSYYFENDTVYFIENNGNSISSNVIPIDSYVDISSKEYSPMPLKKEVKIGYTNDSDDYYLNSIQLNCKDSQKETSDYGILYHHNLEYTDPNQSAIATLFSATRFFKNNGNTLDLVDLNDPNKSFTIITTPDRSSYNPSITNFVKGIEINANRLLTSIKIDFPIIMNETNFNATKFEDIQYTHQSSPRLLLHLGNLGQPYDSNLLRTIRPSFNINLNNPKFTSTYSHITATVTQSWDYSDVFSSNYWVIPTISSFDLEYPTYANHITPSNPNLPTQSLRYDVDNGLSNLLFSNYIETNPNGTLVTISANLPLTIFKTLRPNTIVKLEGTYYNIMSITDYDITNRALCKLELLLL